MVPTTWMSFCWVETDRRYSGGCFCVGSYTRCETMHSSFESSGTWSWMNMAQLYENDGRRDLRPIANSTSPCGPEGETTGTDPACDLLHPFPSQRNSNITLDDTRKNLQFHLVQAHQKNYKCTTVQVCQKPPNASQFKLAKKPPSAPQFMSAKICNSTPSSASLKPPAAQEFKLTKNL